MPMETQINAKSKSKYLTEKKKRLLEGEKHRLKTQKLCLLFTYPEDKGVIAFSVLGLRIILSRLLTIWLNLGRLLRSFCQQSNMSWCSALGQSIGGGSR